jgi:hypothetical protein
MFAGTVESHHVSVREYTHALVSAWLHVPEMEH